MVCGQTHREKTQRYWGTYQSEHGYDSKSDGTYSFPSQINRTNGVPNGRAFTPNHPNENFQSLESCDWVEKHILTPLRQNVEFANLSDQLNRKYPQGKFAWNTTNQYPSSAFIKPYQMETDNLFGCLTLQCEHCLYFEIYPFYFYDQGNIASKTTKVDHVCPYKPLMATFLSDNEKKIINAEQTNLMHSKLKSAVLNQWSNDNSFYLFATNCLIPTQKELLIFHIY